MENNNERKVLLSIKLSTLILIAIALLAITIGTTFIIAQNAKSIKVAAQENKEEKIEVAQIVKEEPNNKEVKITANKVTSYDRKAEIISSRSTQNRDKDTIAVIEEKEEEIIEEHPEEVVVVSTPIDEVSIAVDMDLTVRTGLSREDFIKLMAGVKADTSGFFEENAGYIYDMCEKYSLNEIFFCGLISAESGWNIAQNHRNTHNYISLMSSNGLIRFASVEEGLEKAAETLHNRYLTPGGSFYYGPTLSAMKTRFCPASPTWVNLVYGRMQQIMNSI